MAYWKCPSCGFEAQNEKMKQEHVGRTANDPKHQARPSNPSSGSGQPWGGKTPGATNPGGPKPGAPTPNPSAPKPGSSNPWQPQGGKGQKP